MLASSSLDFRISMLLNRILVASLTCCMLGCRTSDLPTLPNEAVPLDGSGTLTSVAVKDAVRSVTSIGTLGWDHGFGFEISESGEIAGRTDMGSAFTPSRTHAVFWSARRGAIDLGTLGGPSSETRSLNNHGMVSGMAQKAGDSFFQRHPTVWIVGPHDVQTIELGSFAHGQAEDVNDQGDVVGWSAASPAPSSPPTAFRWSQHDGLTTIPPIAGPRSRALGITGAGDIVGASTVGPLSPDHAVIWKKDGTVVDIGTLGFSAEARSMNDVGEITGLGRVCPTCPFHAFYWSAADGIIDLGAFGGTQSFAFEIDNHGRVAGRYDTAGSVQHAFLWSKATGKIDLPTLGGPSANAGSINPRGQITGRAQDSHGVFHAVIWQLGNSP
jgi:probable HAF family extracellular repeat protein